MTPRTLHVLALSAGLSNPSSTRMLSDLLSSAARRALEDQGAEVEVETVEVRDLARETTEAMLTGFPGERLEGLIGRIRRADAMVAVTPIFNTGASGIFKSLIDAVPLEVWTGKPVLLGATAGSARHSLALEYAIRPMFVYLRTEIVPTAVFAASADFGAAAPGELDEQPLAARARRAGGELAALLGGPRRRTDADDDTTAGSPARERPTVDAATDFVPMENLLHRR